MHIPDGFVGGAVNATTAAFSAAGTGLALWRARKSLDDRLTPLLSVTAAFVFAAQMLNFPIAGGTSGHLLGGVLAAVLLGPWNALLVMTVVLVIQCLAFGDGGVTALGSNIFNMGWIDVVAGYGLFRVIQAILPKTRGAFMAAVAVASWAGVVAAAMACAAELAISGTIPLGIGLPAMVGVHALIGIGEAIITTAAVSVVLLNRPDLVSTFQLRLPAAQGAEA